MQDYLIEYRRLRKENEALRARVAELEAVEKTTKEMWDYEEIKTTGLRNKVLWTCDECGGTWPEPHFDNPDLQAEFDAVTTCNTCVSLEMAKSLIQDLQKEWNPASEPPEHDNFIALLLIDDKGEYSWEKARYTNGLNNGVPRIEYRFADCNVPVSHTKFTAIGWRDLPPMPESRHD